MNIYASVFFFPTEFFHPTVYNLVEMVDPDTTAAQQIKDSLLRKNVTLLITMFNLSVDSDAMHQLVEDPKFERARIKFKTGDRLSYEKLKHLVSLCGKTAHVSKLEIPLATIPSEQGKFFVHFFVYRDDTKKPVRDGLPEIDPKRRKKIIEDLTQVKETLPKDLFDPVMKAAIRLCGGCAIPMGMFVASNNDKTCSLFVAGIESVTWELLSAVDATSIFVKDIIFGYNDSGFGDIESRAFVEVRFFINKKRGR